MFSPILLELIDYIFQFIQINMKILKDEKLKDIIYQKELLMILIFGKKTIEINQLIQI